MAVILPNAIDQSNHALLNEVIAVPPRQVVGAGELADQAVVTLEKRLLCIPVALLGQLTQALV